MSSSTAGKGPGIVFRAGNGSGAVRLSIHKVQNRAVLEVLDAEGHVAQVRLGPAEIRKLAGALLKTATALLTCPFGDEITHS